MARATAAPGLARTDGRPAPAQPHGPQRCADAGREGYGARAIGVGLDQQEFSADGAFQGTPCGYLEFLSLALDLCSRVRGGLAAALPSPPQSTLSYKIPSAPRFTRLHHW